MRRRGRRKLIWKEEDQKIPDELGEWAMNLVALKNIGQEVFPAMVRFTKQGSKWNADII